MPVSGRLRVDVDERSLCLNVLLICISCLIISHH